MKIAVATPRCGPPSWKFHDSMNHWCIQYALNHPDTGILLLHPERILPIDVARNLLVRHFLQTDADYMWCLDQDAVFLPGTLDRLLSRKLPVVSALEMMRLPGICYPMALKGQHENGYRIQATEIYAWIAKHLDSMTNDAQILDEILPDSLLEVGFTGCHCLLIRRDVLEEMEEPWFQGYQPGGEDQWFCERAFAMGIPTYVDMTVLVGHAVTDRTIGALDFMAGQWFMESKAQAEEAEELAKMQEWTGGTHV